MSNLCRIPCPLVCHPCPKFAHSILTDGAYATLHAIILHDETEARVAVYYTLSAFGIRPHAIPPELLKKLPHHDPLPAILLGRLAVDRRY